MSSAHKVQALVLGGGISGLVAARDLSDRFDSVLVLEKGVQLGGSIGRVQIAGASVDSGAEAFAVMRNDTLDLIEGLGLADALVVPGESDARIRSGGDTYLIPYGVFGIPGDLDDPAVLAAVGPEALAKARELDAMPWNVSGSISIGELVRLRLGDEFVQRLLAPVVGGVHAANPDSLEADAIVPGLLSAAAAAGSLTAAVAKMRSSATAARPGGAIMSLRGGMHALVDALASDLTERGVSIRLSATVTSVASENDSWRVETESGDEYASEVLVVALPAKVASKLLAHDPELSQALASVQTVDVALVLLALRAPELADAPLGSGVLVTPGTSDVTAKASTHATAKWEWLGETFGDVQLIRFSYGRNGHLPADLASLPAQALADAKALYGLASPQVVQAETVLWPGALVLPGTGHLAAASRIKAAVASRPNLAVIAAGLAGNGITGAIHQAREAVSLLSVRYFGND